jgi:hypothetical protein
MVKYALMLARDFYVQIYVNVRNDTMGMALIYHGQRLYGRDSIKGRWHRHPFEAPDEHDTSPEGAQAVTLEEFLREVQEIIEREELL